MFSKKYLLLLFFVLLAVVGFLAVRQTLASKIDNYIKQWVDNRRFTGSVLVAKGGKIILSKGYGMANYELDIPNTPQTKFHIGSLTKQFTSMAIMILVKQGKLKLENTVAAILPDYPKGEKITVHQLLTMSSGIPDYINDFEGVDMTKQTTLENIINSFKNKPLKFEPGTQKNYNNSNYALLAAIIEKLSQQSYEEFLQTHIFKPLGMKQSGTLYNKQSSINRAQGYSFINLKRKKSPYYYPSSMIGTGGLYSTVEDVYRWDRTLYTEKLLPKNLLNQLWKPYLEDYAHGWIAQKKHGRTVVWHSGEYSDCVSIILRFVDDDFCIIILGNISAHYFGTLENMATDIAAIVFGKKPEFPPKKHVEAAVDPKIYDQYVGTYETKINNTTNSLVVTKKSDLLWAKGGEAKMAALPESETTFFVREFDARISFIKNEDGKVTGLKLLKQQPDKDVSLIFEKIK